MKKIKISIIATILAFTFALFQYPLNVEAQDSSLPSPKVTSSKLVNDSANKELVATFAVTVNNTSGSTLKIPEDGFEVLLKGTNNFEGAPAEITSYSANIHKNDSRLEIPAGVTNATFNITAEFDSTDLYTSNYTAYLGGVYYVTLVDPDDSSSALIRQYVESPQNSTQGLEFIGEEIPVTPYDNYTFGHIKISERIDPATSNKNAIASIEVYVQAKNDPILIYKDGFSVTNGQGTDGSTTIRGVSSNMIDKGSSYMLPAHAVGTIEIESAFDLWDLPRDNQYDLTVGMNSKDMNTTAKVTAFIGQVANNIKTYFSNFFIAKPSI